jgi:hypothetical protein
MVPGSTHDPTLRRCILAGTDDVCSVVGAMVIMLAFISGCLGENIVGAWELEEERRSLFGAVEQCSDRTFCVVVPTGVGLQRIALGAARSLTIGDGVAVSGCVGQEPITVAGLATVKIGAGAQVDSVYGSSAQPMWIGPHANVRGFVKASGTVERALGSRVRFGTLERVEDAGEMRLHRSEPASPQSDIPLMHGTGAQTLAPGSYDVLSIEHGAEVVLRTGHYDLRSLVLAADSSLSIDDRRGPVYVWVRESLKLAVGPRCSSCPSFLLGFGGDAAALPSGFCGVVIAPRARLTLADAERPYRGGFFADSIDVGARVVVHQEPFCIPAEREVGRECLHYD